ncbi:hypothetical protein LTV02_36180 [Nocardia yamanashiensis]|uniref:hypothetical protein n=1 Tax=Nocardia yamanashiensis TaxID=209247 RepID=UPI001E4AB849|nr:hypothetical protein [Nocardia yamanashiensis]UGT41313.1 hypothetical protein LTV02_36180 [Nocardia yamanashiensis]
MAGKHIAWILRFVVVSAFCFMGGTIVTAVALGDRPDDPGAWVSLVLHGLRSGVGYAVVVLILLFVAAAIVGKVKARRAAATDSGEPATDSGEPVINSEKSSE